MEKAFFWGVVLKKNKHFVVTLLIGRSRLYFGKKASCIFCRGGRVGKGRGTLRWLKEKKENFVR